MLFSALTKIVAAVAVLSQVAFAAPTVDSPQTQALTSHNAYRTKHHVAAVRWSQMLADHAASVTQSCVFAHNVMPGTGQNIAYGYPSMTSVVDAWYNEVKDYDYNTVSTLTGKVTGHFTQVVWKGTTEIGCASKACPNLGGTFYVCDYSPPGNFLNQYAANVFKP